MENCTMHQSWMIYILMIWISCSLVGLSQRMTYGEEVRDAYSIKHGYILNNSIFWIAVLIPIIVSGFRYEVGVDFSNYYEGFYRYDIKTFGDILTYMEQSEPAILLLRYINKILFDNPQGFFLITSMVLMIVLFVALDKRRGYLEIYIGLFLFFCLHYAAAMNIVRQYIAVVIGLLAFVYVEQKNPFKFFVCVGVAICFHYSALILLPIYCVGNERIGKIYRKMIIVGGIVGVIFFNQILSFITGFDLFGKYAGYMVEEVEFGIGVLILNLPLIMVLYFYRKRLIKYNPINDIYIYFILLGVLLKYLGYMVIYLNRMAVYFQMVEIILLPQLMKVAKSKTEKYVIAAVIFAYGCYRFIYTNGILDAHSIFPYAFNW